MLMEPEVIRTGHEIIIHFATTNPGKIRSAERRLEPHGIKVVSRPLELEELQVEDPELIASRKAKQAFTQLQQPVFVIDAALEIRALNGFPHAYAKYIFESIGVAGILRLMSKKKDRYAEFVHVLAYNDGSLEQPKTFIGRVPGTLTHRIQGDNGTYGWSDAIRIFKPEGWNKTQGQMTDAEQLRFRQQTGKYYEEFADWLRKHHRHM